MENLSDILVEATRLVGQEYFHLDRDGGDPVYRERVYCYELYHQMRLRWPPDSEFRLNGEVDKSAHPILSKIGIGRRKPDFLVHQPGYMEGNSTIIEVKPSHAGESGIAKDLKTLTLFINNAGYRRAIYLIYGYDAYERIPAVEEIATTTDPLAQTELWVHSEPGRSAALLLTLQAKNAANEVHQ
jgi:hypothetical protein